MRHRLIYLSIFVLYVLLISTGCGKKNEVVSAPIVVEVEPEEELVVEEEPEEEIEEIVEISREGQALNPLTGLWITEEAAQRRPFAVMINNLKPAIPQSGISQADIIYEVLVEGGIVRLMAMFQEFDSTKIGPVRSARHYFLDMSLDHDGIYMHYGKSPQALTAFSTLKIANLEGLSYLDEIMCYRDKSRVAPHNAYTSYDGLMAGLASKGYRTERDETIPHKFIFSETALEPISSLVAQTVRLPFSKYQKPWFEYDEASNTYKRFQYDKEHIDVETNTQLNFTNIIVQFTKEWVIKGDTEGRLDLALVSKGEGYYVTGGYYKPITWEKTAHHEPTRYYDMDGQELVLSPGKSWIAIFPVSQVEGIEMN